jgi:hypothetical protein
MILAGAAFFACAFIKETYAPVILKQKAAKMRKETGDERYWCKYDEKKSCKMTIQPELNGAELIFCLQSYRF